MRSSWRLSDSTHLGAGTFLAEGNTTLWMGSFGCGLWHSAPIVSGVLEGPNVARETQLGNYPNPFNPSTTVSFSLPRSSDIRIIIYDLLGREVQQLFNGTLEAGRHAFLWNAAAVPSGIYYYRLIAGDAVFSRRMILLK